MLYQLMADNGKVRQRRADKGRRVRERKGGMRDGGWFARDSFVARYFLYDPHPHFFKKF